MIESGTIIRVTASHYTVRVETQPGCATCATKEACGIGAGKSALFEVPRRREHAVGDRVRITIAPGRMAGAALLVYGLPLAGLIGGALIPDLWTERATDALRAVCAFTGLGLGFVGLYGVNRWVSRRNYFGAALADD